MLLKCQSPCSPEFRLNSRSLILQSLLFLSLGRHGRKDPGITSELSTSTFVILPVLSNSRLKVGIDCDF